MAAKRGLQWLAKRRRSEARGEGLFALQAGLWERLAVRAPAAGALATIETPATVLRIGTRTLLEAVPRTAAFAALFFVFSEPAAGWLTVGLAVVFLLSWLWFLTGQRTNRVVGVVAVLLSAGAANQIGVHLSLGGFANSGGYLVWGTTYALGSSLVLSRASVRWVAVFYAVVAIALGLVEAPLSASRPAPAPALSTILFVVTLIGGLSTLVPLFGYYLQRLAAERSRAEALLANVLPEEVASELKRSGKASARHFESISVLFADIAGFTPLAARMDPEEVVALLNGVVSDFDEISERYGCEKIRTIGDAYMMAAGVPLPRSDHAQALAAAALDMVACTKRGELSFRIGISSGPVVAGVIGRKKFQYDVWGDTVNTASRMESHGTPGRIQISEATYLLLKDEYVCTPRGPVDIRGKGTLKTWYLEGPRLTGPAGPADGA